MIRYSTGLATVLALAAVGCAPRTITHQPALHPTIRASATTGLPGVVLFGQTEEQVRQQFGERLYVDEEGTGTDAYEGIYALIYYTDQPRQVNRIIFDFDQLHQHGIDLTVRLDHNRGTLTLDRSLTPEQFERRAGCRIKRIPGTRTRPTKHLLVPFSPDTPCTVTGNSANDDYHREYTFLDSYTVVSFINHHLDRLYVFDPSLNPNIPR